MTRITKTDQEESMEHLRKVLHPGDTVHTVLRHVSRSGMYRVIDLYVLRDSQPIRITGSASDLLEGYDYRHNGAKAGGCGMDMGFALVYNLSSRLNPDGHGCIGEGCPSNDHSNGDRDYTPHGHRKPVHVPNDPDALKHWHRDGGYALRHRWM